MSDFSDRPFVAGSLIGLRAFDVDVLGRLTGPIFGGVFGPAENVARCGGGKGEMAAQITQLQRQIQMHMEFGGKGGYVKRPHSVSGVGCACGFYAYFDGSNTHAKPDRVTAIIEGYGVCTVGDKGFRAEKARLVAIVDPTKRRWWNSWKFNAALAVLFAAFAVSHLFAQEWITGVLQSLVAVFNITLTVLNLRSERKASRRLSLVAANYPDVPRYRTTRAALRKHPLTVPERPTPETAEDFWTRSAS